ncbi:formylmethanofuran dehydrogenase subunit A [Roseimaritima ulvae]|uniref:Formyltransferase/hydrolase complex Fhc subunit A n=1 Tax=Roseimaritima ulvae TaxID=980254 RepID=A0A5B9QJ79_9BACT|nr:formylmethanofuran dehydrogenase subunit A [Roseimaritima ulvae]QEG38954.1 Formyltransferase/hydrolase complex Fhc subunit A [Roseimaritima ulvae]
MLRKLTGGRLYDPASGLRGEVGDLWIDGDRFVAAVSDDRRVDEVIDLEGMVVMAGAIDLHTHIGGGKLTLAKMLLSEQMQQHRVPGGVEGFLPTANATGRQYAQMGYAACFEPAVIPCNARAAHAEMADTPYIDTGGYCLLGNDDCLLRMLRDDVPQALINDYVAWIVQATQCIAVKVVNAGGISAYKFDQKMLDVDTPHPHYGVTPALIIRRLARAVHEIGLVHPLHVHCSNLGVAGNVDSTLKTIAAADGFPVHLTHVQFHSYGAEGEHGFSSAAEQIVRALDQHPNVTIDVGQVMFGQTVTISADAAHQTTNRKYAKPRKSIIADIECEAGCGVVPFRYRKKRFVSALQWAIGLELFLMVDDPSRVFLTTDHPNGGAFTTYPHLIRLLGDRSFRETALAEIHADAAAASQLAGISREYGYEEIATMTRSAPANILGLSDMGRLSPGAVADVVVYQPQDDLEKMFARPDMVLRRGCPLVRDGRWLPEVASASPADLTPRTLAAAPAHAADITQRLSGSEYWCEGFQIDSLAIDEDEMEEQLGTRVSAAGMRTE